MPRALLLSASRADNTDYLTHALPFLAEFLSQAKLNAKASVLFVPYAGVTISYDEYFNKVKNALESLPIELNSIHHASDMDAALNEADAVLIGGGNTFQLLNILYKNGLIDKIRSRVEQGMAYIGWSAGSNIAGLSIKTTNDMPIIEPPSFEALGIVPVQLNPHYTEYQAPGHNGETREMRLAEFMVVNPETTVIGIQEGSALLLQDNNLTLVGDKPAYVFMNQNKTEVAPGYQFDNLLEVKDV